MFGIIVIWRLCEFHCSFLTLFRAMKYVTLLWSSFLMMSYIPDSLKYLTSILSLDVKLVQTFKRLFYFCRPSLCVWSPKIMFRFVTRWLSWSRSYLTSRCSASCHSASRRRWIRSGKTRRNSEKTCLSWQPAIQTNSRPGLPSSSARLTSTSSTTTTWKRWVVPANLSLGNPEFRVIWGADNSYNGLKSLLKTFNLYSILALHTSISSQLM